MQVNLMIIVAATLPNVISARQPEQRDVVEAIKYGLSSMKRLYEEKEPQLYAMGLFLTSDNPAHTVATFNQQSDEYKQLARSAYATLEATKQFRKKFPSSLKSSAASSANCPARREKPECRAASERYRTSDGSCNNAKEPWWGSAMSTMQRFLPAAYDDGIESIRRSVTGRSLPSARRVSDVIHRERDSPLGAVTHMLMQWGQFVDHDVTATGQSRAFNGSVPQCCSRAGRGFQPPESRHPDCLPIAVPAEDSQLGEKGVRCLEFVRSGPSPAEDDPCGFGPREQLNQVTSFLDASTVYSSSARQSDSVRAFRDGLLAYGSSDPSDPCGQGSLSTGCFRAGDGRLSEQPALISLHLLFLRLHNYLAGRLLAVNAHWSDERIFQESRKIVGAIVQHVTYHEFLPIVLGPTVLKTFDLELVRAGYYAGYDPSANPTVANEFSSAAYRFGHSLVQNSFTRYDGQHCPLFNNVKIHEEFSNPINLETAGSLDRILLGLINQPAQKRDEFISDELTNHLFQTRGFSFGMDLAALNVQRGRDHGIAPFVEWRRACALNRVKDWSDLERVVASPETVDKFRSVYAAVEDIDLFSAGLAEKPLKDGLVGPTLACIIAQQFRNLRRGDRFWYENPFPKSSFSLEQLGQIRRITLAKVICATVRNQIDNIQPFVMLSVDELKNQRLSCQHPSLSFIDLEPWREARAARRRPTAEKPNKTRINQQNRITVKRPLGSAHENLTIVVNNNAVYSPVYVKDSVYGSHQNAFTTRPAVAPPPLPPVYHENKPPTQPYYPHNFGDQYSPDSPRYSSSPDSTAEWLSQLMTNSKRAATQWTDNLADKTSVSGEAWTQHGEYVAETSQDWDLEFPKPIEQTTSRR